MSATDLPTSKSTKEVNINNNNNNVDVEQKEKVVHKFKGSECAIQSVTVYNDRAEITRSVVAELKEGGVHELVIGDLSPDVEADSVRIYGGEGNAAIVEVSHQEVFGEREDLDETAKLFKKIETIRLEKQRLTNGLENNKKQRAWLEGYVNTVKTGGSQATNPPLAFEDMKIVASNVGDFMQIYSSQLARLDEQDNSSQETIKELSAQETTLKKQIAQLQQQHIMAFRREVSVVLSAPSATKVSMQLSYIILNARWTASYDARMMYDSDELELTYFGSITNASGEDWNNVRLFLSTAAPSIGGAPPPLRFLRIEADHGQARNHVNNNRSNNNNKINDERAQRAIKQITTNIDANLNFDEYMQQAVELQTEAINYQKETWNVQSKNKRSYLPKLATRGEGSITVVTTYAESSHVGSSNATFEIPRRSTIVSDNKPHKVTIVVVPLKARLSHYATPDASGHVYLKATATNTTEQYPFLAGPVNVFMNANFISKSDLPDVSPQEKFSVFLGADSGVKLEVKPVRRVKEKQTGIINKTNMESFRHTAVVRNTRKTKINISVLCQVPSSNDERIKVKVLRPDLKQDNSVKFLESKLLKWKLVIQPGHHEELNYHYTVEWPATLNVIHMAAQY